MSQIFAPVAKNFRPNNKIARYFGLPTFTRKSQLTAKLPTLQNVRWGEHLADYMLEIDWKSDGGWTAPGFKPAQNLSVHPSSTGLHYGIQAFDGLKAFKGSDGSTGLFRPDETLHRFRKSCERNCLPSFDERSLLSLVKDLVKLNEHQIPDEPGCALYIRPCAFSTETSLGVRPPTISKLIVTAFPCSRFFLSKKTALLLTTDAVRAWPGGAAAFKLGGHYAPTMRPLLDANSKGFSHNLWTFPLPDNDYLITEGGAMNVFFVLRTPEGGLQFLTPPDDGLILPGVTRMSVLELLQQEQGELVEAMKNSGNGQNIQVCEAPVRVSDLRQRFRENAVVDMFATGTGVGILPVDKVRLGADEKDDFELEDHSVSWKIQEELRMIQKGVRKSPWLFPLDGQTSA